MRISTLRAILKTIHDKVGGNPEIFITQEGIFTGWRKDFEVIETTSTTNNKTIVHLEMKRWNMATKMEKCKFCGEELTDSFIRTKKQTTLWGIEEKWDF